MTDHENSYQILMFSQEASTEDPIPSAWKDRVGHGVYALKNTKDMPARKAVSQNLIHTPAHALTDFRESGSNQRTWCAKHITDDLEDSLKQIATLWPQAHRGRRIMKHSD